MKNTVKGYNYPLKEFFDVIPHENAIKIADYEFFWDCWDELAPFGSEEGALAFMDFCDWRIIYPDADIIEYYVELLSSWDLDPSDFNECMLDNEIIIRIIRDFDFEEKILILDIIIIATGFAQLILEGKIDDRVKDIIHLSLLRQLNHNVLDAFLTDNESWKYDRYKYLQILLIILEEA